MTRAVFLDALGTLLELEPPWVPLRSKVPADVTEEALVSAVRNEMDYYREHAHEGRDVESLADLRERCAALISRQLEFPVTAQELLDSVRFDPYPDAVPALAELRDRGLSLVVVSNWDCSLETVLDGCGLNRFLDGVVTSAGAGSRKPDPGIFRAALELAGCRADEALHVGDTPGEDADGARAAGIRALIVARDGGGDGDRAEGGARSADGVNRIASLGQIVQHL
ncbi:MAG: HAD-superfamily hydrolase, subfamily variant 1 [Solirubrobacterales bacterium]|nr:HAD-superfamily hydrolase, subfamily variant 1 [Solirubrobacterales bacterium]